MNTLIKERPILFSGAMVHALQAGTKTQTRRTLKVTPRCSSGCIPYRADNGKHFRFPVSPEDFKKLPKAMRQDERSEGCYYYGASPYGEPGDRLWVKETFSAYAGEDLGAQVIYRADEPLPHLGQKWQPSIFMPRKHSRILLEVVSVRVERLQDISEADAKAEGYGGYMDFYDLLDVEDKRSFDLMNEDWDDFAMRKGFTYPIEWYHMLWDKINGVNAWQANPWVWVVEFRRIQEGGEQL